MALIKCEECGKQVSERADACPSCGNPIRGVRSGFVGISQAGRAEADVKGGVQRAKGRYELGSAFAFTGIALSVVIGFMAGSWILGGGLAFTSIVIGVIIQYS